MSTLAPYVAGGGGVKGAVEGGGFVKGVVTYMVMDDLVVKPMSTISSITMLNKFNVKEVGALEEKMVSLEMKEGLMLLKASFQCKNVLTKALYVDELENLLDDFMLSLNTEIDDGSIEEMADNLMIMHEECLEGNFASIERLRQSIPSPPLPVHVMGCEDDSDTTSSSGDESMEMGDDFDPASNMSEMAISEPPRAPAPAPTVDADGWTTVTSRRNRGSRH
nr:pre-rRNA-processing protein TSR2-like [Tanacetum cinerariifolium]